MPESIRRILTFSYVLSEILSKVVKVDLNGLGKVDQSGNCFCS